MNDVHLISEAVKKGERITVRLLNYRKNGEPFWNLLTVAPVKLTNGQVAKFIGVQVDVTTRTEGAVSAFADGEGLPLLVKYDSRLKQQNMGRVADVEEAVKKGEGIDNLTLPARAGLDVATTLERIQQSFVIADPSLPDCPIVFASDGFLDFTGYTREDILGRNCRFLQGPRTDRRAVQEIRKAIDSGMECTVRLLNYTKQGKPFWNMFTLAPVRDEQGKVRFFAGVQVDVTVYKDTESESRGSLGAVDSEDGNPDRTNNSTDAGMKEFSSKMAGDITGAVGQMSTEALPWVNMVGRLAKPKPHQVGDTNWAALQAVVNARKAAGNPARLTPEDFIPVKRLGHGDVGSVHLVTLQGTEANFAMKVLVKQEMHDRNKLHRVRTEGTILESVDHPFIATMYSAFQTETHLYFVMEYCEGGELYETLQRQPGKRLTEETARFYAAEVLVALQYLHLLGFIYRDLKPENILLRKSGHIIVTDFDLSYCASSRAHVVMVEGHRPSSKHQRPRGSRGGSGSRSPSRGRLAFEDEGGMAIGGGQATEADAGAAAKGESTREARRSERTSERDNSPGGCAPGTAGRGRKTMGGKYPRLIAEPFAFTNSFVGTEEYLAPEVLNSTGHTSSIDWWELGIFLHEMVFGTTPFRASRREQTFHNILNQQLVFPTTPTTTPELKDLLTKLLQRDPSQRLGTQGGAEEVKSHPFFKSVDWALLRWEKPPLSPKVVKHTAAVDDDAMFDMDEEQQDGGFGGQGVN
jgi:PAS domain S-box-containing protein